jgi:hypothetical protein
MLAFILLAAPLFASPESEPPVALPPLDGATTLRLTFEQGFDAECSAGSPAATLSLHRQGKVEAVVPEAGDGRRAVPSLERFLVPGLVGKGLTNADRDAEVWLAFDPKENLRARSSTILWWIQAVTDQPGNWCGLMLHLGNLFVVAPPGHQPGTVMAHSQRPTGEYTGQAYAGFQPRVGDSPPGPPTLGGAWRQLGVAWDSRSLSLIVDGVYASTVPLKHPFADGELNLTFVAAGWGGNDHDVVILDEVTVYNRLLTAGEVAGEYQRLKPKEGEGRGGKG